MKIMFARIKELLFQNRSTKQTVVKNIFWLSFGEISTRLIRGVIVIYAARILGAAEFGIFSYAVGLAGLFTIFSDLGIMQILTRELAQKPQEKDRYFATASLVKSVLLVSTSLIIAFIAPIFSLKSAIDLMPLMALLIFFDGLREYALSYFRAMEKMEIQAFVVLVTNIVIAGGSLYVLWYFASAKTLSITYVLGAAAGAMAAIFLLRRECLKVFRMFDKSLVPKLLSYSWPLLFMGMLGSFMLNTDNVLIGWLKGEEAVGLYAAAQKIVQILYILPAIVASATFPTIARYITQNNSENVRIVVEKSMTMIYSIAIPIAIGGIILAEPITLFLYKSDFASSINTFRILLLTVLVTFPGIVLGNLGIAYNLQKTMSKYVGIAALSNLVLDIIFIPIFGIAGSAAVTVLAQLLTNGLQWRLIKKINNFLVLPHLPKIFLASILVGLVSFALNYQSVHVGINILVSGVIYFAFLYLIKEPSFRELTSLLQKI